MFSESIARSVKSVCVTGSRFSGTTAFSMRLNENIRVVGKSVVMMPYKAEYVPK